MSKDVIIAGSVAVCCLALIAVAVLAPKSKSEPAADTGKTEMTPADGTVPSDPLAAPVGGTGLTTDHPLAPGAPTGLPPIGSTTAPGLQPLPPTGLTTLPPPTPTSPTGSWPPANGDNGLGGITAKPPAPIVAEPPAAPVKESKTHVVANGELLGDIALKYYGSSKQWRRIVEANPGLNPNHVKVGQKLVIPAAEDKAASGTGSTGASASGERTYTVKKNDGYHSIAARELGSASRWKELEKLNGTPSTELKIGQVIKLPPADSGKSGKSDAGTDSASGKVHTVAAGEHLADIAKKYYGKSTKADWKKIVAANPGTNPDHLKIGQKLTIPDTAPEAKAPEAPLAQGNAPTPAPAGEAVEYTVQKGDTPMVIAQRQLGPKAKAKDVSARAKEIVALNPGLNPSNLRLGQKIKVPGKADASAAPAPAPAPAPLAPPSGFGAPVNGGAGAPAGGAFGAPANPNAFGAPATPNAFGAPASTAPATSPAPFGAPAPGASAFGAAPADNSGGNAFGSPYNSNSSFAAPAPAPAPSAIR